MVRKGTKQLGTTTTTNGQLKDPQVYRLFTDLGKLGKTELNSLKKKT